MKEVRPTSGRVLLALFSILDSMRGAVGSLEGARFLDLFAGTGRVGLEALRRGAASVVFVESVRARAQAIERSVPHTASGGAEVLDLELRRAVAWLRRRKRVFDVVFADPPYPEGWGAALLDVGGLSELLAPDGVMVVEHASREPLTVPLEWQVGSDREYGETILTFLSPLHAVREAEAREGVPQQEGEVGE